jgi:hypothetical protein
MEIKLKTTPIDQDGETLLDEYGTVWKHSGHKPVHGIFTATTKGTAGEDIHGFYQNGAVFIVNRSDARNYFNSMNWMNCLDMPSLQKDSLQCRVPDRHALDAPTPGSEGRRR